MRTFKSPDVYIEEITVFPPSVAEVETAIPAFIGYTQKADDAKGGSLILKPTKIRSLKEYELYFGVSAFDTIAITVNDDPAGGFTLGTLTEPAPKHLMWYSMRMFFDNGGGQCYVVSVGTYQAVANVALTGDGGNVLATKYGLQDGLDALRNEDEPTLIVFPESIRLSPTDYESLVQASLEQCAELQDRFAVFDIHGGGDDPKNFAAMLPANRKFFGTKHLKYGAAYYPFIRTTLNYAINETEANVLVTHNTKAAAALGALRTSDTALYNYVKSRLKEAFIVLPPSPAVVGVYASVDSSRGVWKAPANVSLANVLEPVLKIDSKIQDDLNVDATTGISINAIRAFMGKGTLVWGARTLAGNDNEWRYIPVRRFFNMVEESVKKATYWAVFEPNDANTWVKVRGMIEAYLVQKWRDGALTGATPQDAFFVRCGLGVTMNHQDILEGRMIVEIGMAVARPAEFIILKFSHKLQKS